MNKLANRTAGKLIAVVCAISIVPGPLLAQQAATPTTPTVVQDSSKKIPTDQLDSLVAPIALYPDPLLAQTLAASATAFPHHSRR